jgi:hypothetical protein
MIWVIWRTLLGNTRITLMIIRVLITICCRTNFCVWDVYMINTLYFIIRVESLWTRWSFEAIVIILERVRMIEETCFPGVIRWSFYFGCSVIVMLVVLIWRVCLVLVSLVKWFLGLIIWRFESEWFPKLFFSFGSTVISIVGRV